MAKRRGLNRGLDSLLGGSAKSLQEDPKEAVSVETAKSDSALQNLAVDRIERGRYQPRSDFNSEALQELADSIKAQGVVQPIVVRSIGRTADTDRYEIIAGERRWRAAQIAGLDEIPAVIRDVEDEDAIAMALIENIQRENLNPLEEARALDRLIREFDLTHAECATAVGRSRASVTNLLRLQDLSDRVKPLLVNRELEMGHARALLAIQDPVQQLDVARQVVRKGLSVRATEQLIRRAQAKPETKKKPPAQSADVRRLEIDVSERLGAKVSVQHTSKGNGKLVISYNNLDELDGILKHIK